ncbi:hypothetical protein EJ02DRAFT_436025 [Clathrospora elynae]|uniref:Uncharacterized protein n=1 Tax=Clathrospora elynae TaxID=706981 RepID=A0A6A5SMP6_9PLEO|nr:hypothetical protein EJ02DRAFT_436025 [Clathrospora elynae]
MPITDILKVFIDVFFKMLPAIEDAAGILAVLSFQAITVPAMEKMQQNVGNAVGHEYKEGPVFICNLAVLWSDVVDNTHMISFSHSLHKRLAREAGATGLNNDYIYMNYASLY